MNPYLDRDDMACGIEVEESPVSDPERARGPEPRDSDMTSSGSD
jgi:hypothetical protein